ncbi:MAG TPA: cupredoxin family copper-binding protein [Chitinophagaceae bacterium]|nr:cupredoxin family copper-binding protein [Chitinophagaceae bacterium]
MKKQFFLAATVLAAGCLIFFACSKGGSGYGTGGNNTGGNNTGGTGTGNTVSISGMAFSKSDLAVSAGTTVTWTNNDAVAHTVTADDGSFDSGSIASGKTFTHTFSAAGSYPYHCSIHSGMTAKITVN